MAISPQAAQPRGGIRDHGFHDLVVRQVVRETEEASSFVLDVPASIGDAFVYRAGQFLTFRVWVDGQPHLRCYSMSSSSSVDNHMQVTVKRVPGGLVSNWLIENLAPGDTVEATRPSGVFCLGSDERDIVAFSGGSGITPVLSIMKAALAATSRRVHLLYANRDHQAVIFAAELEGLEQRYGDRLNVVHHLDVERGFVDAGAVRQFMGTVPDADCYICGPGPFMDVVERTLLGDGVDAERIHIERFTPPQPPASTVSAPDPSRLRVSIEIAGRTDSTDHHPGATILQTARQMGMSPPFSCESGNCATCMAKVVEGAVTMFVNNALTADEVDDGWVLTCQAVPTTASVHVIYGYQEA